MNSVHQDLLPYILGFAFNSDSDLSKRLVCKSWNNSFFKPNFSASITNPESKLKIAFLYCKQQGNAFLLERVIDYPFINGDAEYPSLFLKRIVLSSTLDIFNNAVFSIPLERRRDLWEQLVVIYNKGLKYAYDWMHQMMLPSGGLDTDILYRSTNTIGSFHLCGEQSLLGWKMISMNDEPAVKYHRSIIESVSKILVWTGEVSTWLLSILKNACYLLDQTLMDLIKKHTDQREIALIEWTDETKENRKEFLLNNDEMFDVKFESRDCKLESLEVDTLKELLPKLLKRDELRGISDLKILQMLCRFYRKKLADIFLQSKKNREGELKDLIWWLLKWIVIKENWLFIPSDRLQVYFDLISDRLPSFINKMFTYQTNKIVPFFAFTQYKIKSKELIEKIRAECKETPHFKNIWDKLEKLRVFNNVKRKRNNNN